MKSQVGLPDGLVGESPTSSAGSEPGWAVEPVRHSWRSPRLPPETQLSQNKSRWKQSEPLPISPLREGAAPGEQSEAETGSLPERVRGDDRKEAQRTQEEKGQTARGRGF